MCVVGLYSGSGCPFSHSCIQVAVFGGLSKDVFCLFGAPELELLGQSENHMISVIFLFIIEVP